LYFNLKN